MRFRFCGGLEPPDWLLAEIPLLATLDEAQVASVCQQIRGDGSEIKLTLPPFSVSDTQAIVAVLRFVMLQAAKYDVSEREVAVELLQLGVSSELADCIAREYAASRATIRQQLHATSFKFPTIEQLHWRVLHHKNDDDNSEAQNKRVEMRLQLDRQLLQCDTDSLARHSPNPKTDLQSSDSSLQLTMTEHKFLALYEELTQAHTMLQSLRKA